MLGATEGGKGLGQGGQAVWSFRAWVVQSGPPGPDPISVTLCVTSVTLSFPHCPCAKWESLITHTTSQGFYERS